MTPQGVLSIFLLLITATPVYSASTRKLEKQVEELRTVHEAQARNLATALNQIQEVLSEFQRLHGKVDGFEHANQQLVKTLEDSQRRLTVLEDKMQILIKQLEEIKAAGLLQKNNAASLKEFEDYERGLTYFNTEDYTAAIHHFRKFMKLHPKSTLASNAQYWIGESYYAMRDHTAAIAAFHQVVKDNPKSSKVPPSLLKQGFAFFAMQSFPEAKAFLKKLIQKYPASDEAILAKAKIKEIDHLLEIREKEALKQETL